MLKSRGGENYNLCSSPLKPILFQSKVGSWRSKLIIHDLYLTFNLQVLIVRSLRSRKLTSWVFKGANYQNNKFHWKWKTHSKCVTMYQNVSILFLALQLWINGNIYQIYVIFSALLILHSSFRAPSLIPQKKNFCTFWQHSVGGMVPKKNADVFRFLFDA